MGRAEAQYFVELSDQLALLYEDAASARRVAQAAGLNTSLIVWSGTPAVMWRSIVDEARKTNYGLLAVAQQVMMDYADNAAMMRVLARMPRTDSVGQGFERVSVQLNDLTREVGGLRQDIGQVQSDLTGLKKNVLNAVLDWATNRQ